jgi:hypothetical protein
MTAKKPMLRSGCEIITPEKAKQMLTRNVCNRPIDENRVKMFVYEINRDNFHNTGEGIKFAENGDLLDGQHRLLAIVRTGKAQELLVVRNLAHEVFKYMDTGKIRTAADVLAINGIPNPKKAAAVVKFISSFKRGAYSDAGSQSSNKRALTNSDVDIFIEKHGRKVADSIPYGYNKNNRFISPAVLSGLFFIFAEKDQDMADDFCHRLATGLELTKESPIYLLRQRLINDVRSTRRMRPLFRVALCCKAWNHFRNKKKVTNVTWDPLKEPFPKPI